LRITEIRESTRSIQSNIRNAYIDFFLKKNQDAVAAAALRRALPT
jgi:hypothetical protein